MDPLFAPSVPVSRRSAAVSLVALCLTALAGCGTTRGKAEAAHGMDRFHAWYNASDFEKMYDTADPVFQRAAVRQDFLKFMRAVRRKLGAFKSCEGAGYRTSYGSDGATVTLQYRSQFEKGDGDETFGFLVAGSRTTLRTYRIDSTTLLTE